MVNKFYFPENLPITAVKDELIDLIQNNQVLIVAGETGSGKTTQLPKLCLAAGCVRDQKRIACTQPRRIAASSVAKRVAEELGDEGEALVGYRVRFVDRTKKSTKIKFLTDGLLLAEAAADNFLGQYDVIIIDEAHERSLNIDFLLGLVRKLLKRRPELKVIISSATLDTEKFSHFFSNARVVNIPGKTFPVEVRYSPPECTAQEEVSIVDEAVRAVREVIGSSRMGDILVFMPTERDIVETVATLNSSDGSSNLAPNRGGGSDVIAIALYGRMSIADQSAIFTPSRKRKIVVATNVAETSITVPGIRFVIDSGLARIASYSPRMRSTKLPIQAISSSSADQRKGRCGRVGPGVCIRLYSEEEYLNKPKHTLPEIMRSNLAEVILRMVSLRLGHPAQFPFIDPPHNKALKAGIAVLTELGALEPSPNERLVLSKRGKVMARLPLDPALSRIVLEGRERGVLNQIIVIVAALSIQDPRLRPAGEESKADSAHKQFVAPGSDFITYLKLWNAFSQVSATVKSRTKLRKYCRQNYLAYQRLREWMDIYEQICRGLEEETQAAIIPTPDNFDAVHQSLLCGLLRNIAVKKEKKIFTAAHGKEVMIFPGSGQFAHPPQWLLAAELVETTRLYARTVGAIDPMWLESIAGGLCKRSYSGPHWEKRRGQVVAFEKVTLFGLVINERRKVNYGRVEPRESRQIFIQSALVEGDVNQKIDFLQHNRALLERLQEIEDKVRARHLIDDYTLFSFYDSRIPVHIITIAGLMKALPQIGSSLLMAEDDLYADGYDPTQLEQFPERIVVDNFHFPLHYKFEPGSAEDGVTVMIPASALPHITSAPFEWLVPGLLEEKIVCLLKSLPKSIRKRLVPVAETGKTLMSRLVYRNGSLFGRLAEEIYDSLQVTVQRQNWQLEALPLHLCMRFCLTDQTGKVITDTRDFDSLFKCQLKDEPREGIEQLKRRWEKECVEHLADHVPERLPIENSEGDVSGYMYPGLVDNRDGTVGVKLFPSHEDRSLHQRQGLLVLYKKALAKQVKLCTKELTFVQGDWPLFNWMGGLNEINGAVRDYLLVEVFGLSTESHLDQDEFNRRVASLERSFFSEAALQFKRLRDILAVRRETYDLLTQYAALAEINVAAKGQFVTFFDELFRLLPRDFLGSRSMAVAERACRYMEALKIRAERAYASPATDAKKAALVSPFVSKVQGLQKQIEAQHVPARKKELSMLLTDFEMMLEEYKISIFAPEIKTIIKVSEKRLKEKAALMQAEL